RLAGRGQGEGCRSGSWPRCASKFWRFLLPMNQPPHPFPTAIELSACCSKHDFFDPPLKMIRTIQRQFGPGRFALGPHGDSSAQEHALELFNYLLDRKLAVKQIQQLVFQGVIRYRAV